MMLPEDTIGISEWKQWSQKEKLIFLTGFRVGTGPIVAATPSMTDKQLTMNRDDFEVVLKRVDSIYADTANKDVTIRGAIEVALMQIRDASPEAVAKKLEAERTRKEWGF
jgi:hypothetical protein